MLYRNTKELKVFMGFTCIVNGPMNVQTIIWITLILKKTSGKFYTHKIHGCLFMINGVILKVLVTLNLKICVYDCSDLTDSEKV